MGSGPRGEFLVELLVEPFFVLVVEVEDVGLPSGFVLGEPVAERVGFAAGAFGADEGEVGGAGEPAPQGVVGGPREVGGPVGVDLVAGQGVVGFLKDHEQDVPVGAEVVLGGGFRADGVVGGVGAELDEKAARGFLEAGQGVNEAAAGEEVAAGVAHFEADVGETVEGAGATRGLTLAGLALARMMQEENGDAVAGEAAEGLEGFLDYGGVVFAAAGEEGGQGVDDDEVEAMIDAELGEVIEEGEPLGVRWPLVEGLAEEADVAAEIEALTAGGPEVAVFLGDDGGFALFDGEAGEGFAGASAGEQEGDESGFAGLPEAGEQGDLARGEEALPEPVGVRGIFQGGVAVPEAGAESDVGHGGSFRRSEGGGRIRLTPGKQGVRRKWWGWEKELRRKNGDRFV